jgi:hypothetical protein
MALWRAMALLSIRVPSAGATATAGKRAAIASHLRAGFRRRDVEPSDTWRAHKVCE